MPNNKKLPVTPENMRRMAIETIRYLSERGLFYSVDIYAGGMHYSDAGHPWQELDRESVPGTDVWAGGYDRCPCEYANPETLTMTFEGSLYHAMNYGTGYGDRAWNELDQIFARYGLYLEMGHAWSLACYPEPE